MVESTTTRKLKKSMEVEPGELYPLPDDYYDLSREGQKQARLSVVMDQSTPDKMVTAWVCFRQWYLISSNMFYKNLLPSPPFHYQIPHDMASYRKNILAAPRGGAKCLREDQRILTQSGFVAIKEVKTGTRVLSSSSRGKISWKKIIDKEYSGRKRLYRIKTRMGWELVSSPDHRVLTVEGWKHVGELLQGIDYMATPRQDFHMQEGKEVEEDEGEMIGILLGDGTISKSLQVTTADQEIVSFMRRFASPRGWEESYLYHYVHSIRSVNIGKAKRERSTPIHWMRKVGIAGMKCKTKRIPPCIWNSPGKVSRACLRGLFDTDGTICKRGRVSFCSSNFNLAKDVHLLLLQEGIRSGIISTISSCKGKKFSAWKVNIDSMIEAWKFHERIGFRIRRKRDRKVPPTDLSEDTYDTIPFSRDDRDRLSITPHFLRKNKSLRVDNHYNLTRSKALKLYDITQQDWIKERATSDLYWDRVESVREVEKGHTWDIQVEENHNFLCEGLFVHNSVTAATEMPLLFLCTRSGFETGLCLATDRMVEERFDRIMEQLEDNPGILEDFGRLRPAKGSGIWNRHLLRLINGARLKGFSTGGKMRGARPDLFLLDDPEFDSKSKTSSIKLIEDFERLLFRTILQMLEDGSGIYWIGTIINSRSFLYAACEGEDKRFRYWNRRILVAAEKNEVGEFTNLLWPEKWDSEKLKVKEAEMGPAAFAAEFLNSPLYEGDRILSVHPEKNTYMVEGAVGDHPLEATAGSKVSYFLKSDEGEDGEYRGVQEDYLSWLNGLFRVMLVDYAYTTGMYSDFSYVMVVGFDNKDIAWVLDVWTGKVTSATLDKVIVKVGTKWMVALVAPESVSIQKELTEQHTRYIEDVSSTTHWYPKVVPPEYPRNTDKGNRIATLEWRFHRGRIKFPQNEEMIREPAWVALFSQIDDFTLDLSLLPHDDALDTLAMMQFIRRQSGVRREIEPLIRTPEVMLAEGQRFMPDMPGIPLISAFGSQDLTPEMLVGMKKSPVGTHTRSARLNKIATSYHNRRKARYPL